MLHSFLLKIRNWCIKEEYNIGFLDNNYEDIITGKPLSFRWMRHKFKDSWFADPFILDVTDMYIYLLVEDYYYPIGRGRISMLKIDKKTLRCEERKPLLTIDTHLSFPAIIRKNNEVYVYPESGSSGELKLYKLQDNSLIEVATLCNGAFSDAVITGFFDKNYCFTTSSSNSDIETRKQFIYQLNTLNQNWHLLQTILFKEKTARNAGDFFKVGSKIYRPTQDCNVNYGGGIIINEVELTSDGKFSFKEVCRFNAKYKNLKLGVHTLNHYKDVTVIDAHGYCYPLLARIAKIFM